MKRIAFYLAGCFLVAMVCGTPQVSAQAAGGSKGGATKENLDLPYDSIGSSEQEEEAPEIVVFYGQQYEGDGFFFCLDKSGTMNEGNKFQTLKKETLKNITQWSERVQFGIVFFDANVKKFPTNGRPANATPAMKAAATQYVMAEAGGHGTCCKEALIASLTQANQATSKRKVILYLSDGGTTCPGVPDQIAYGKQTLTEVASRNTNQIQINTFYIGAAGAENPPDTSEKFMKDLAHANHGQETAVGGQ